MTVTTERLPRSLIALSIEVDEGQLDSSMNKAVRRLSEQVKIPGFRPGKAPRAIVERTVGEPALLQEALDLLLPDLYREAIESEAIEAIGQPEFELKSTEPVVVHAMVPVRPTIDLNEYGSLRAPRPEAEATPMQVEDSLLALRRRFATLEPADRPVQWGDSVRADVRVSIEGQDDSLHVEEDAEFRVAEGTVVSLPGFVEHLIGLESGRAYDISFELPDDFEATEMAGKTAKYHVTLHEVKQEVLPELDDEFVKSLDEGLDAVDDLRKRVQQNVQQSVEAEALAAYQDEVLDLLLAGAEIDYPEVLVEREVDRLLDQQSNHASHTAAELDQWLERIGKSEQEVRDGLLDSADLNVRHALVLGELVGNENIEVSEERVEEEIGRLIDGMLGGAEGAEQREALRGLLDTEESRASARERLMTQVALERLVEICSQPEEAESSPRARGSRRRRAAEGAEGEALAADDERDAEQDETDGDDSDE